MAGLKHRYGALNWLPCHDQLARLAELVDTELHHVSSFKVLRRSHAQTHSGRRAGTDDIPGEVS